MIAPSDPLSQERTCLRDVQKAGRRSSLFLQGEDELALTTPLQILNKIKVEKISFIAVWTEIRIVPINR